MPSIPGFPAPQPPTQPQDDCFDLPMYFAWLFAANTAICNFLINLSGGSNSITVVRECAEFDAQVDGEATVLTPAGNVDSSCKLFLTGQAEVCVSATWRPLEPEEYSDAQIQVQVEVLCDGDVIRTLTARADVPAPGISGGTSDGCARIPLFVAMNYADMGKPLPAPGVISIRVSENYQPSGSSLPISVEVDGASSVNMAAQVLCEQQLDS